MESMVGKWEHVANCAEASNNESNHNGSEGGKLTRWCQYGWEIGTGGKAIFEHSLVYPKIPISCAQQGFQIWWPMTSTNHHIQNIYRSAIIFLILWFAFGNGDFLPYPKTDWTAADTVSLWLSFHDMSEVMFIAQTKRTNNKWDLDICLQLPPNICERCSHTFHLFHHQRDHVYRYLI